ncbi:MAG: radical SAM protein [Bacillota bacterium]|nr:radical SAM protein [Bacillota bacterium]
MHARPRQKILPFFLPMSGCPHRCVYCDQYVISGEAKAPGPEMIRAALAAFPPGEAAELAYYGGSFTCLPRRLQAAYLQAAEPALAEGRITGIRISTRPDAVDADTCAFLRENAVCTVELGIQSFSDDVLKRSGRAYDSSTARDACLRLRAHGLRLGIQLMTGLPGDREELARESMRISLELKPELLRIYPTLVLENTGLAALYRQGDYQPQSLTAAVALCADLLALATAARCPVQRIGLNPSPELEVALLAGPYHPAFGGLVREALRLEQIRRLLRGYAPTAPAVLRFPRRELPLVFGQKRAGLLALGREYPLLALEPDAELPAGLLLFTQGDESRELSEEEYCCRRAEEMAEADADRAAACKGGCL